MCEALIFSCLSVLNSTSSGLSVGGSAVLIIPSIEFASTRFIMPIVNIQRNVTLNQDGILNVGDPSLVATGGTSYVDLAVELSKLYGKSIRQGHSFKVLAVQTALRPVGSGYDSGLSAVTRVGYIPTTSHSRKAWNLAFKTWQRQKRLYAGATGGTVRYDDFELAYDVNNISSRTSHIYQSGIDDTSKDSCVLYGTSSNSIFAVSDFYDEMNPVNPPSRYSWNDAVVKDPKFDDKFPYPREFFTTADLSTVVTDDTVSILTNGTNMLSGSTSTAPIFTFPEPANVCCGLMKFESYVTPDDTNVQAPDSATLEIVIHVKSWKPLLYMSNQGVAWKGKKWNWRKSMVQQSNKRYNSRKRYSRRRKR